MYVIKILPLVPAIIVGVGESNLSGSSHQVLQILKVDEKRKISKLFGKIFRGDDGFPSKCHFC